MKHFVGFHLLRLFNGLLVCQPSKWNYIHLKVKAILSSNDNVKLMLEWQALPAQNIDFHVLVSKKKI